MSTGGISLVRPLLTNTVSSHKAKNNLDQLRKTTVGRSKMMTSTKMMHMGLAFLLALGSSVANGKKRHLKVKDELLEEDAGFWGRELMGGSMPSERKGSKYVSIGTTATF
jgi:hypothetical protein